MRPKIAILVEGETERAFFPVLREFLQPRVADMPKLDPFPCYGRVPTGEKLKIEVQRLLSGRSGADAVIALTDVYTGTKDFKDATDAKTKMRQWVGTEPRFYPHVACYDFEAWLLPFWKDILLITGNNRKMPSGNIEDINHGCSPSYIISEVFRTGERKKRYIKSRDCLRILKGKNLMDSANVCPELKYFLNTILQLSGGLPLP